MIGISPFQVPLKILVQDPILYLWHLEVEEIDFLFYKFTKYLIVVSGVTICFFYVLRP